MPHQRRSRNRRKPLAASSDHRGPSRLHHAPKRRRLLAELLERRDLLAAGGLEQQWDSSINQIELPTEQPAEFFGLSDADENDPVAIEISGFAGDVIKIDLGELTTGASFSAPSLLTSGSGELILPEQVELPLFASSGVLYFAAAPNFTGSANVQVTVDAELQPLTINVMSGFSTTGAEAVKFGNSKIDALGLQHRLRYLGYPASNGDPLTLNGAIDSPTQWAIGLFNAAMTGDVLEPSSDVRRDFINEADVPRWIELDYSSINIAEDGLYISPNFADESPQTDRYTSEVFDRLRYASENVPIAGLLDSGQSGSLIAQEERLELRKASSVGGGPNGTSEEPGDHHAGLEIDFETPASNSSQFPFFATITIDDVRYVAGPDDGLIYHTGGNTYVGAAFGTHPIENAVRVEDPTDPASPTSAWNNREVLLEIRDLIQDNSAEGYDLQRVRKQLTALLSSGVTQSEGPYFVETIYHNDPRTWTLGVLEGAAINDWNADGTNGRVRFRPGVNGVFQADLVPPVRPDVFGVSFGEQMLDGIGLFSQSLSSLANFNEFAAPLPILGTSLGELVPISEPVQSGLYDVLSDFLVDKTEIDSQQLVQFLSQVDFTESDIEIRIDPDSVTGGRYLREDGEELRFNLSLLGTRYLTGVELDLGSDFSDAGLHAPAPALVTVMAESRFDLSFGIDLTNDASFFMRLDQLTTRAEISDSDLDFELNVGFLGTNVVDGAVDSKASSTFEFLSGMKDHHNRVHLDDLQLANEQQQAYQLQSRDGYVVTELPLTAFFGDFDTVGFDPTIFASSDDPFDDQGLAIETSSDFNMLLPFLAVDAEEVHGMLESLGPWFQSVGEEFPADQAVYFAKDLTTNDLFDLHSAVDSAIYSEVTAFESPTFATAQELVSELGPIISSYGYDPITGEIKIEFAFSELTNSYEYGLDLNPQKEGAPGNIQNHKDNLEVPYFLVETNASAQVQAGGEFGFTFGISLDDAIGPTEFDDYFVENVNVSGLAVVNSSSINSDGQYAYLGAKSTGGYGTSTMTVALDGLSARRQLDAVIPTLTPIVGGDAAFTFPSFHPADNLFVVNGNDTATFSWPDLGDFDTRDLDVPDEFICYQHIAYTDFASAMRKAADFLNDIASKATFTTGLPLVGTPMQEFIQFAADFDKAATQIEEAPAKTIQKWESTLKDRLAGALVFDTSGSDDPVEVGLSFSCQAIEIVINIDSEKGHLVSHTDPFVLAPGGYPLVGGELHSERSLDLMLRTGVDISQLNNKRVYLGDDSELTLNARSYSDQIDGQANFGPLSVTVGMQNANPSNPDHQDQIGKAAFDIDGLGGSTSPATFEFRLADKPNNRYYTTDSIDLTHNATGKAGAELPLYFPSPSEPMGGTTEDDNSDGHPDNSVVFTLNSIDVLDFSTADDPPIDLGEGALGDPITSGSSWADGTYIFPDPSVELADLNLLDLLGTGLKQSIGKLSSQVDSVLGKLNLPIVGDDLIEAFEFITTIESQLQQKLDAVQNKAVASVQLALYNAIIAAGFQPDDIAGPGDTLSQKTPDGTSDRHDVVIETSNDSVEVQVRLVRASSPINADFGFDLGLPGLGFDVKSNVEIDSSLDFTWDLLFGVHKDHGFYLMPVPGNGSEFSGNLGFTIPGSDIKADFGLLQVIAKDKASDPSELTLGATIDLVDPTPGDGRILISEVLSKDAWEFGYTADVDLNLDVATDLAVMESFPSLSTDFLVDWSLSSDNPDGTEFVVQFANAELDLGGYVSKVLRPLLTQAEIALAPFDPLIEAITRDIPVLTELAELAGEFESTPPPGVQLADLISYALNNVAPVWGILFDTIIWVDYLVDLTKDVDGSLKLDLGSFNLTDTADPRSPGFSPEDVNVLINKYDIKSKLQSLVPGGSGSAETQAALLEGLNPDPSLTQRSKLLTYPLLEEPAEAFKLLLGQEARIAYLDLPKVDQTLIIPKISTDALRLGNFYATSEVEATIKYGFDFDVGYDTKGLRDLLSTGGSNPAVLLNGLYLTDKDERGVDKPEAWFLFDATFTPKYGYGVQFPSIPGIFVGPTVDLVEASGQIRLWTEDTNGTDGMLRINLRDPNNDGKTRFNEIGSLLDASNYNPFGLFDLSGKLKGDLTARLWAGFEGKIPDGFHTKEVCVRFVGCKDVPNFFRPKFKEHKHTLAEKEWRVERTQNPILDLDKYNLPEPPPAELGHIDNGVLYLHIGTRAELREEGATDFSEKIAVTQEADEITVTFRNDQQSFSAASISQIVVDAGIGNDEVLFFEGVTKDVVINGGSGNDVLRYLGSGKATIYGFGGKDQIVGGSGNDRLEGGDNDDVIEGNGGEDTLRGGSGNDRLSGGDNNDTLEGGIGDDRLEGNEGEDDLDGGGDNDILYGNEDADTLRGGDGNDVLDGGVDAAADKLYGGIGHDELTGGGGIDTLFGNEGNDTIFGGAGDDQIVGGDHDDLIYSGDGNDFIVDDDGNNRIFAGAGNDTIGAGPGNDYIAGGTGRDDISAGNGINTVFGEAGNDSIIGGTGNEYLHGGSDDDTIKAAGGDDDVFGGEGNDDLQGEAGKDHIRGEAGDDTIYGGLGNDLLQGGTGGDRIYGDQGNDTLEGASGSDLLRGGDGNDLIKAGSGNDRVYGDGDSDTVQGGDGSDTIDGNGGADVLLGQRGNDTIHGNDGDDRVEGGEGDDELFGDLGNDTLIGGVGNDTVTGGWGGDRILAGVNEFGGGRYADANTVYGDEIVLNPFPGTEADHGDVIFGDWGVDTVYAGLGHNSVTTFSGNDLITAQSGNDTIDSGEDHDTVDAGNGDNRVVAGSGIDVIDTGTGKDTVLGGDGDDTIRTREGDDHVDAGPGNDDVDTAEGDDVITAGSGSDVVRAGWGADAIFTGEGPNGGGDSSDIDFVYADPQTFTVVPNHPTNHADAIVGSFGNDIVEAGPGNDVVSTLDGNDFVEGFSGADDIDAGGGNDIVFGHTQDRTDDDGANDTIQGGDGNDQLWGGDGDDSLGGGAGDDRIAGEWGDDEIDGGDDKDLILAGRGDDLVDGGAGDDRIEAGHGNDTVGGGGGSDVVLGQQGDDSITGGSGNDDLRGGPGLDWIDGEGGNDIIDAGAGIGQHLFGGPGDDTITGSSDGATTDPDFFDTTFFGDVIDAGPGKDTVFGLGGADLIRGGDDDDRIESGTGSDHVIAGAGNDWVFVGFDLGEVVYAGDGNDTVIGSDFGDDELFGEDGQDDLFGQGGNDTLRGGLGADVLDGGAGTDRIEGEDGDDELRGGGGPDDQLLGGAGNDLILGSDDGRDFIQGGPGRDTAMGGGGNDVLRGEDGDDVLRGGPGDDLIIGGLGSDVLTGDADHDLLYGHNEPAVFTPADDNAVDYLYGDFATNQNEPGSGRDQLDGGGGNDLLFGEGDDDLIVSTAGDLVDYGAGESATASDFVPPIATPDPAISSVAPLILPEATLPTGLTDAGRWSEFSGSASGNGVSNAPTGGIEPTVAVADDGTRYFAWVDARSGNQEVYVAKHTDAGGWESLAGSAADGGVSQTPGESRRPSLAIDAGGNPVVAWTEVNGSSSDIHVARFDSGTWNSVGATANVTMTTMADEAVLRNSSDGLVLAWTDRSSGVANGYLRRFDGSTWNELSASASGSGITGSATDIEGFRLAVTPGKIAVSWTQHLGEQTQIFAKEFSSATWNELAGSASGQGVSDSITSAVDSSIAYWNNQLFVSWSENDGPPELPGSQIGLARFQANAWSDVTPQDLLPNSTATRQARLASGGGQLYLSWTPQPGTMQLSTPQPSTPIYVARFDGSAFVEELPRDASGEGIHTGAMIPSRIELRVSGSGNPYLAWQDNGRGEKPQVFLRGNRSQLDLANRLFVADGTAGKSLGELLAANDFGPGDVILIEGPLGENVTVEADDSGLLIVGDHHASISGLTVNATDVTIQKLSVGTVEANGDRLTLRESDVSQLTIAAADAVIVHNDLTNVDLVSGAVDTEVQHNRIGSLALNLAFGVNIRHNFISGGSGVTVQAASGGQVIANKISGTPVGLTVSAAFDGVVADNDIQGQDIGVQYDARAVLSGNRISGSPIGVAATVVDLADAFGFVGTADPNEIFGNDVGVELTGRMQGQLIRDNAVGVIGTGILGADDFSNPNRIEGNTTGVDFEGEVRYNRIGYNEIGIVARPAQLIAHNLFYRNSDVAVQIDATDDVKVVGNTAYAPSGDNIRITGGSKRTELWNNVLWAESGYDIYVDLDSREGFFSDYNVLHAGDTGKLVHYVIDFTDVLDWQVDVNEFDLHSIGTTVVNPEWSEPRFVNRWRDDYRVYDLVGSQRFTSPTLAAGNPILDAGRSITSADSVAPLAGHNVINLLSNPSFESGLADWVTNPGSTTRDDNPIGYDDGNYFAGGSVAVAEAVQTVDLAAAGVSLVEIDSGDLRVHFGARLQTSNEPLPDEGRIELELLDAGGVVLDTLEAIASNTNERWELVGGDAAIPAGTRSARFVFTATRNTGSSNDAWMDSAFVRIVDLAYAVDAGPELISPVEQPLDELPSVAIRFPDLYTDWERDKPKVIRWDSYNNQTDVPIKIDLYQGGPEGPVFVTNIVAATPDDGEYTWTPANSGVDFGTHDLLIQVSRSDDALVFDRSTETFAVPENTTTFYVNDGSQADDQYTTAVGATRHSGKTPDEPKRLPVNLLRMYSLGPNDTLHIDDGTYAQFKPIYLSGTIGVGDDEGFVLTGPTLAESSVLLKHLVPGTNAPLITLDDADFMTIQNLDLVNAQYGVLAKNLSTDAAFANLTVTGHAADGIRMEDGSTFSVAEHVTASNNGGHGIYTTGVANRLSEIVANDNGLTGITIGGAILTVEDIQANGNLGDGLAATGSIPTVVRIEANDNGGDGLSLGLITALLSDVESLRNDSDGIRASVQAGTEVLDNIVRDNGVVGIALGGTGGTVKGNTIENNGLIGLSVGSNSVIQSNTVIGNSGNGIRAGAGSVIGAADLTLGLGNIIRDNGANGVSSGGPLTVAGNTIAGHTTGAGVSIRGGLVTQNLVFANRDGLVNHLRYGSLTVDGNRIYNNLNVGVVIGGGATVRNNTIYSNANGIAIQYDYQTAADPAMVQNNLVYDHSGWAIQTATSNDVFENNTILQTTGNGISISGSSTTRLRNNIVSVDEGIGIEIAPNSLAGLDSDFNLFQTGATGNVGRWNGFLQDSISAWQTASNEDSNSISGDPLFVDVDGPDNVLGYSTAVSDGRDDDFHLQSTEGRFTGAFAPVLDSASGLPVWLAISEVTDPAQSPAIDRGDISIAVTDEPSPHGGYVNLGAYGNTVQASKSPGDFVFVSTPNGSEVWAAERTFSISWRASDVGAGSSSVINIDLIRDSVTDVTPLLTAGMNIGSYDWTIPVSTVPADDYRIRITRVLGGDEIVDESDAPFSIIAPISFYYVNDVFTTEDQYAQADGNDANDGLSPLTPKASIQSVLASHTLSPGDTILVDDGNYVLDTDIVLEAALQGVTIQGPTVEAAEAVIDRNGGNAAFVFTGADDITIRNLTITNANNGVLYTSGDSDRIQILENRFFQNLIRGLYVAQSSGDEWLIADNQISETQGAGSGTSGYGIIVWDTDAEIRGNEVVDNPGGMYLKGSAVSANDNDVYGNTVYGFFVSDGADLEGNFVHNNGTGIRAFTFSTTSPTELIGNRVFANGGDGILMQSSADTSRINAIGNRVFGNDRGIVATRHPNASWPRYHGTIRENLIYGNLSSSLVMTQFGSGLTVHNNTIVADGHDAVQISSGGNIDFRNNLYSVSNGAVYGWTGASVTNHTSNFNQFDLGTSGSIANLPSSTVTNLTDWILDQQQDVNSVSGDAQFVDPAGTADYHLAPGAIGIDAGDPATPVGDEPAPNGGRINVGAYGGTAEATVSAEEELTFVIAPNGLNRFSAGGTMRIEWMSTLDSPVNIDLYAATGYQPGVSVPVASIADDLVAAGVFDWSIPADGSVPLDTSYLVVVQSTSGTQPSDVSDAPFYIANGGKEYYVNDGSLVDDQYTTAIGDDLNLGKSPDQPMRSLGALLRSWTLSPGDIIYVDSGNYNITSNIVLGAQHSGLTLQGPTNGSTATLDRGGDVAILQFSGADDVTVRDLTFVNAKAGVYGYSSSDHVTIESNRFISNTGNGILVTQGNAWTISDNFVAATMGTSGLNGSYIGHGIAVVGSDSLVQNNLVSGNLFGITLRGGNTNAINNELRDNRNRGISIADGANAVRNLVFESDVGVYAALSSNYPPGMTIQGNTLFGNGDAIVMGTRATSMPLYARDNRIFGNDRGIIASRYYYAQDRFYGEITGNLLYDNQSAGLVVSYATTGTLIANNTIVADGHNAVQLSAGSTGVEVRNNLFSVSNGFVYDWSGVSVDSQSSDYNQFDLGTGGKLANLSNSTVDSFSHWVLYHRQDINGQEGPAGFVDPDGPNDVLGFSATPIGDPIVMDHQNAGFSTTGQWTIGSTQASGDEEFVYATGRENRAQWSFTGLSPGEVYQVTASFPGRYRLNNTGYPFSSAAVFNVQSDGKINGFKVVSQTGDSYSIVSQQLGSYQAGADGTLIVELEGATTSQPAVADSVTLQQIDLSFGEDDDFHLAAGAIGIDRGDPADSVGSEPAPNGGRINIGAYGGTDEATPSAADEILQVLSPNGLNRFSAGKTVPITWRSEVAGPVEIFLFEASGYQPGISAPVLQIADDIASPGEFNWTIPDDGSLVTDQEYLISIASTSGSQPSDVSDRPFLIANGGNQYYINDASLSGDVYTTAVGDDSNTGKSPDQPMADLQALLQVYELGYGDVVYIDTGVYSPPYAINFGDDVSGITLQGPVSETAKAVFDGLGSGTGFQFAGGDDITMQNLSITNFDRGINSPSVDSDRITIRDSEIYANLTYGIYLAHSNAEDWVIANNRIYDHSGTNDYGVYASQSSVELRNNSIFGNYFGAYGSGTGAMLTDNTVFNNTEGLRAYDHSSTFGNNVYGNSIGIRIYSGYGNGVTSAVNNEVMANDIGIYTQVDNHFGVNRQVLIADNRIYNNTTGIVGRKSSRYSARVTADISENYIYSNSMGIDLAHAATSAKIQNNLIYGNTNLGISLWTSDQASVVNNTIVQEVGDVIRIEGSTDQLVLKNNILSTQSGNVLSVAEDSLVNQFFDYNLLHQGTDPNAHIGLWGTTVLDSLSEWQTTTGLDANSVTGDPGFLDIDGADNILGFIADNGGYDGGLDDNFLLTAGSIAIDRGETASAPEFDILGNARVDDPGIVNAGSENGFVDLGSYEFQGDSSDSTPPTVVGSVPVAVHASGGIVGSLTEITLSLSEAINEIDANAPAAYSLLFSGGDGIFGNLDDNLIEVSPTYEAGSTTIRLTPAESLEYGSYRLTLFGSTTLHDASGLRLDGDGDAAAGGDYIREFSLEADLPPTSSDVSLTIDEDVETAINLVGDDGNPAVEQNLIFEITSLPEHGTLSRTAGGTMISLEQLPLQLTSSTVYFKPAAHSHQGSNFTFITRDDDGADDDPSHQSDPATVSISITPVNDPPVVADATVELGELSAFGITVATMNADDPDLLDATADSLSYAIVAGNDDGIFQITQIGRVVLVAPDKLDFESKASHELTVRVTDGAGVSDTGALTITLIDEAEAQVDEVIVGGGESHRSRVDLLTVKFNRLVELDFATSGPFRLVHVDSGDAIDLFIQTLVVNDKTVAELRFGLGPHVDSNGNLADGRYQLTVRQTHVSAEGFALDGNGDGAVGDDFVFGAEDADQFFRFFGDSDGDGDVDGQDYGRFGLTFLKSEGEEGYNPLFDYDGDGDVDGQDYGQFGLRFLKQV